MSRAAITGGKHRSTWLSSSASCWSPGQGFQFIWHEIPVLVTFESDWKKAKESLRAIASRHAEDLSEKAEKRTREAGRRYMISYTTLRPAVYTTVKDSGVLLTIRYLIEPRRRRDSEQRIWEEILEEFSRHEDIDFAYPTRRVYNNVVEGKEGTRSSSLSPDRGPS